MYKVRPDQGLPVPSLATRPLGELRSHKGIANGYAPLGADGKIPSAYLPTLISSPLITKGDWNATTNTPTIPAAAVGNIGWFYIVSTAGTTTIDGINVWDIGDQIISNGTTWEKIPYSEIDFNGSPWLPIDATTARSDRQRLSNHVDVMDFGADPTGVLTTFHTAYAAALANAKSRGINEIWMREPGYFVHSAPLTISDNDTALKIRTIGAGSRLTHTVPTYSNNDFWRIGTGGGTITRHIILEGISAVQDVAQTNGAAVAIRNADDITLVDVEMQGYRLITAGIGASALNDVIGLVLDHCAGATNVNSGGVAAIELGSGGSLVIKGKNGINWTGSNLAKFLQHADATYNWDGVTVQDVALTRFLNHLTSSGQGISALYWSGVIQDGFDTSMVAAAGTGGINKDWVIINNIIQSIQFANGLNSTGAAGSLGIVWGGGAGLDIELQFQNNNVEYVGGHAVWLVDGNATLGGNRFSSCGQHDPSTGTSVVRVDAAARCNMYGNTGIKRAPGDGTYTYGVEFIGSASSGERVYNTASHQWVDFATAATVGTP